jgi:farnesyl diphosphate synthase
MADKAQRKARFEGVFDVIADELISYLKGENMPQDAVEWYKKVSDDFGRLGRGK